MAPDTSDHDIQSSTDDKPAYQKEMSQEEGQTWGGFRTLTSQQQGRHYPT